MAKIVAAKLKFSGIEIREYAIKLGKGPAFDDAIEFGNLFADPAMGGRANQRKLEYWG
jgi:hypothetical protein